MVVDPAVSVGSVQVDVARPFRVLAALMVVRSSVMCTAFTRVVPATSGLSVKPVPALKVAVTDAAAFSVTVQVLVPVQAPLQPEKKKPVPGAAVRVTTVPVVNEAEHVPPQEIPAGELVTVPVPALVTVSAKDGNAKVAVTARAALIVRMQVVLAPVQLAVQPAPGAAVSVTIVPVVNEAEHVAPQEIPAGLLVTVPLPAPAMDTVSVEPVPMPRPVTSRESASPSAVKLTLVLAVAVLVGANRTVTVAVEPEP